jgi:hypothetical protein
VANRIQNVHNGLGFIQPHSLMTDSCDEELKIESPKTESTMMDDGIKGGAQGSCGYDAQRAYLATRLQSIE